jgi:hypothetical protein
MFVYKSLHKLGLCGDKGVSLGPSVHRRAQNLGAANKEILCGKNPQTQWCNIGPFANGRWGGGSRKVSDRVPYLCTPSKNPRPVSQMQAYIACLLGRNIFQRVDVLGLRAWSIKPAKKYCI